MIGLMGLGKMGRAVAERLGDLGEALVVWNRTASRAEGLAAKTVGKPRDLPAEADVILSILADQAAVEAVYFGENGLLTADLSTCTVVEFCTMSPSQSRALAAAVEEAGGTFLECPVGGTIGPARNGALLGLAGGSDGAFEAAKPVLGKITRRLEHVGPVGTGAAMKLAINLPLMVYWSALGEALGLACAEGVDASLALDILADSSGAIGAAKTRVPPIRDLVVTGEPGTVNFALDTALKDMAEMIALARRHQLPADVIGAAQSRALRAAAEGWGDRDASMTAAFGNLITRD